MHHNEKQALETGVQAVVYGLPLVIMDITMKKASNVTRPGTFNAPVNQFAHVREFPTAAFKDVVRANVDTLYSSAFLDLSSEPLVLSVPNTNGRYYLLPMIDALLGLGANLPAHAIYPTTFVDADGKALNWSKPIYAPLRQGTDAPR